ncbi:T6SS immunity protein Tli4 family protein [Herbaspirillum huttiense]|uniref:T6SS immunity protein Tli4 family protein n=1 Tax=Herbaspirillum huttiense TaxID=863372 RepID=UPI0031DE102F
MTRLDLQLIAFGGRLPRAGSLRFSMRLCLFSVLSVTVFMMCHGSALASDETPWSRDCVGHLEISLPEKADVAATAFEQLFQARRTLYSEFEDGQVAAYSKYEYAGTMEVTRRLSADENRRFLSDIRKTSMRLKEDAEGYRKLNADAPEAEYEEYKLHAEDGLGMRRFKYLYAAKSMGLHAVSWGLNSPDDRIPEFVQFMNKLINAVELRDNFTVPSAPGICMPHVFIPSDGAEIYGHSIATTYRLKSHPDVTVLLEDTSARRPYPSQDPAKLTAVYKSNFFWTQDYRSYDSIKNLLTLRRHNTIEFAGQKGVESMVSMIRKDKVTEDYGYLVVTDGDPNAGNQKPELMLYVIRDAKNAEKRGMKPIDKEEFFKLAREIAASVKRRAMP